MKHKKEKIVEVLATDLLTPKEASKFIGIHVITLRRYRIQGKLNAYRSPGGGIRYRRDDLLELFKSTEEGPKRRAKPDTHQDVVLAYLRRENERLNLLVEASRKTGLPIK